MPRKNPNQIPNRPKRNCNFCDGPDNIGEGVWKVVVKRKYRGSFGKVLKWYCHNCLAEDLEGFHTGGGPTGDCFKKIKKRKRLPQILKILKTAAQKNKN